MYNWRISSAHAHGFHVRNRAPLLDRIRHGAGRPNGSRPREPKPGGLVRRRCWLVRRCPREPKPGGLVWRSCWLVRRCPLLGAYTLAIQAPHLAALAARLLLKLVQGFRKHQTLQSARQGLWARPLLLHPVVPAGTSSRSMAPLEARPGSRAHVPRCHLKRKISDRPSSRSRPRGEAVLQARVELQNSYNTRSPVCLVLPRCGSPLTLTVCRCRMWWETQGPSCLTGLLLLQR